MSTRTTTLLAALWTLAAPAFGWEHQKGADHASTWMEQDGLRLVFSCTRGSGRVSMNLSDVSAGSDLSAPLRSISTTGALMLYIQLPDGRTSRDSFAGFDEQGSISAEIPANHIRWDFFAQGQSLRLQDTGARQTLFESGMKGTGAARLAFLERCGV